MLASIMIVRRHRVAASPAAVALAVAAIGALGVASSSARAPAVSATSTSPPATWSSVAKAYSWQVVRPTRTAGLSLSRLGRAAKMCTPDRTQFQGYSATYGKAPARWFQLFVAKGALCGDAPAAKVVSHVRVDGQRVPVAVWFGDGPKPTLADGYRNGMTLTWKQAGRTISIESTRLHLSQVVDIARSLAPVKA